MPAPPSRATAALRTPPPSADSAPGGEVPKNVLKAAADGLVGPVRLWLNEGGKADTLFDADYEPAAAAVTLSIYKRSFQRARGT